MEWLQNSPNVKAVMHGPDGSVQDHMLLKDGLNEKYTSVQCNMHEVIASCATKSIYLANRYT